MNKIIEPTVNTSLMTDEQVQALLSGSMSWEEAVVLAPGPALTIIEVTPDEISDGVLSTLELDDDEE